MSLLSKFLRLQFLFLLQAHINRTECIIGSAIENINWIDCEGYIKALENDDGESIVLDETFSVGAVCIDLENNTNCSCRFCNNSGGIYSCDGDRINSLPNVTKHADNEARLYCVMNARNVKLIGAYQFSGSSIREIKISNMDTLQIEQRAFSGILNLKTLAVTHSNLGILTNPRYIFAGLVNLTTLDLSYNKIIRWNTESAAVDSIPVLPKLKLLNLSGNPLTTLRNESFDWLQGSQLTHLILRECLLKHIEPGTLNVVSNTLKHMDLSGSSVSYNLIFNLLAGLNYSLKGLALAKTGLTTIPYEVLRLTNGTLTHLSLHGNLFRTLGIYQYLRHSENRTELFPYLPALEELDLRACGIYDIEKGAFNNMPNLRTLYLANNQIDNFTNIYLPNLEYLTFLDLSHNPLQLDNINLEGYPLIETLDLSYTYGEYLTRDTVIVKNNSLRKLSLCNSNIKYIEDDAFMYLNGLEMLDLSGNMELGSNLSSETFKGLVSLQEIHLSGCKIYVPSTSELSVYGEGYEILPLHALSNVRRINLSKNEIGSFPRRTIQYLGQLDSIDLSSNYIRSWNEPALKNNSKVVNLNIGHNYLNYITDAMLNDFKNLVTLVISSNPFVCDCNCVEFLEWVNGITTGRTTDSDESKHKQPRMSLFDKFEIDIEEIKRRNITIVKTNGGFKAFYPETKHANYFTKGWDMSEDYLCTDKSSTNNIKVIEFANVNCDSDSKDGNEQLFVSEHTIQDSNSTSTDNENLIITVVAVVLLVVTFGGIAYWKWWYIRYFAIIVKNATVLSFMSSDGEVSPDDKIFTYDVFISYSDHNRDWVLNTLLPNLESKSNLKVCLHERDFQVGIGILENIIASLDQSRSILLVISHKFLQSQWCQFELHLAQHRLLETRREELILLFLEDIPKVKRPKTLLYLMKTKTYIQWPQKGDEHDATKVFWKRLHNAILRNSSALDKKSVSMA